MAEEVEKGLEVDGGEGGEPGSMIRTLLARRLDSPSTLNTDWAVGRFDI